MQPLLPSDPRQIDDFRLSEVLGRGGQGSVYLGQGPDGEKVAVKVLHTLVAGQPDALKRFTREAEAAQRVAPFCTARVLAVGVSDAGPYIVSEFVPGPSLEQLVRDEGSRAGSGLERLAVATLTALAAIHRAGIVHRDFKPSNVILGHEGPVVIDFGIARAREQTVTSTIMGTPAFMAPEQFAGTAGAAADLFSWASTMVYAATGKLAFHGDTMPAVMHAILTIEPDLSGVPEGLRPLVASCMAKDPLARPTAEAQLRLLTGQSVPETAWLGTVPTGMPGGIARTRMMGDPAEAVQVGPPGHGPYTPNPYAAVGPGPTPYAQGASGVPAYMPGPYAQGPYGPGPYGPSVPARGVGQRGTPSVSMAVSALVCIGLLSLPLLGSVLSAGGLTRFLSIVGVILFMPVIGLALRHDNIGATITSMLMVPLGLLFLVWATVLGNEDDMPAILIAIVPTALIGLLFAATALLAWRVSGAASVLGAIGGVAMTIEVLLYVLVELTTWNPSNGFVLLLVLLSRGLIVVWLWIMGVRLVRRAMKKPSMTTR
ncbi:serine/threonine-protein kinase [Nonomuraea endophytica]|uniref:serine/threonine-protein kinase n=1 Tax=Nonomuraea endophytica TaxID=714136 RepID=UPI0037CA2627